MEGEIFVKEEKSGNKKGKEKQDSSSNTKMM